MKIHLKCLHHCLLLAALLCGSAHAEDIDIFGGTTTVDPNLPNVIFVLDNSANWSRQSQQWPGGVDQGQSEVRAIKTALAAQVGRLNIGLVEYSTSSNSANNDGGYVRHDLQELTDASFAVLEGKLDAIFNNINGSEEKRGSSNLYGYLPYDFYNYLSGSAQSKVGVGTPEGLADKNAYASEFNLFNSPIDEFNACGNTYLIFIGNNTNGSIEGEDANNSKALKELYLALGEDAPDALAGDSVSTAGGPIAMPTFIPKIVKGEDIFVPEEIIPGYTEPEQVIPAATLGTSAACWKSSQAALCTAAESSGLCKDKQNCSCTAVSTNRTGCKTNGSLANQTWRWTVYTSGWTIPEKVVEDTVIPAYTKPGEDQTIFVAGSDAEADKTTGLDFNFDDWAKFLYDYGVPVTVSKDGDTFTERVSVKTYTIDVFNRDQLPALSAVWFSAANAGHGRYFQAKSEDQIVEAINTSLSDIVAVSSSFAAVALPLSATNATRRDNEVYIGMFRPAPGKKPRWFGNVKRFQLALFNGVPELADVNLKRAINIENGFATDCAESFWSSDTAAYWENLGVEPPPRSKCPSAITEGKQWSDLPDGPQVEKGGVAQVTREGPAGTARKLYTVKSDVLQLIDDSDASALGGDTVLDYLRGDLPGLVGLGPTDSEIMPDTGLRASIHGDVVHSRPLTVLYDADTVRLFYGANDGLFRAVDTSTGAEKWALLHPEHRSKIQRLYDNSPRIDYEGADQEAGFTYTAKDYFFDGPTGQIVSYEKPDDPDSEALGELLYAYIYPTMRRGGRMVYGLDVTDPDTPELMWSHGCPNLDNDAGCTAGFGDIGQTWSTPMGGYLAGYTGNDEDPDPVVIFGGGFDDCLNADQAAYPAACSSANGKGVYLVDGVTGALIKYFATDAPVVTEVAPVDLNFDGIIDFVYVADVAGNLYRIRFADLKQDLTNLTTVPVGALVPRDNTSGKEWLIEKIATIPAENDGTQRRFYNAPAIALFRGTIFVTIGSGDRERPLEANYPYAADVENRFYVLLDSPFADYTAEQLAIADAKTYNRAVVNLEGDTMFVVGTEMPEDKQLSDFDGWYINLPARGEQVANPAVSGGGKVFFNTFQPGGVSTGLCERPTGIGKNYTMDLFAPKETEGELCPGGGFCIPPIIATVDVPKGCESDDCYFKPREDCVGDECQPDCSSNPDADCETTTLCIVGGFDVCKLDPVVDPKRGRVYFTEKVDK